MSPSFWWPYASFGGELDGLRGVFDGVVVAVELGRVLGHALVVFRARLGLHVDELLQDADGAE
jgi:hypothetical protein